MAKLFGKDYHEHSNSWFFKSSVIKLGYKELLYRHYFDEHGNVVFRFKAVESRKNLFSNKIELVYDPHKEKISYHYCSECGRDDCKHYLSILYYAYHFINSDVLKKDSVQTYHNQMMQYNEYWQRIILNAKIEISDIYNSDSDKIRFYLQDYDKLELRVISQLAAGQPVKEEDGALIPLAEIQMKALSEIEIDLLRNLQIYKCSFSRKGKFFTIYKDKFIKFMMLLHNLQNRIFIRETGDPLIFSDEEFRVNFQIKKIGKQNYLLKVSNHEQISAVFIGKITYILKKNIIFSIKLPFSENITRAVFDSGYELEDSDLVYLASVVARQMGLIKCYLDFEENITIPKIFNNTPLIKFSLHKEEEKIIVTGKLKYSESVEIPMSLIRYPVELLKYDYGEDFAWFYIPPQIKYEIEEFVKRFPAALDNKLEDNSQLIFKGKDNIAVLKMVFFEYSDPAWEVQLTEELKKEFVYKVHLRPVIKATSAAKIDWFEYNVEYSYKDITFTHGELKKFFRSKEKFLRLDDGRLLYFDNKDAYLTMESVLKKSEKLTENNYKLSYYNLPFIYQLSSINQGITTRGDSFLDEMYDSIIKRRMTPGCEVPSALNAVMRSYQKAGFHWLFMLSRYHFGGILADDMGLGKTIQSISILSNMKNDFKALIICPKTLLFNWAAEIDKFNRNLKYILYEGNQKERSAILENFNVNILFASYSIIQNDIDKLSEINFDYIILDEAQHIKNALAMRTKAIKKLKGRNKIALSGTPIENNPTELWSIFDFLMPGYLPSLKNFKKEYMNKKQDMLKNLVSPFILRRKKKDVLIELPDKQEQIVYCPVHKIQEKMYLQVLEDVKSKFLNSDQPLEKNYLHILAALTRLRQICNHPSLVDDNLVKKDELSGKMELLRELIIDAVEGNKKILIFSQFVKMLQLIKNMLQKEKITFEYMDGSTKNRQQVIDNFNNNNNIRTFLISLKTGGYGLNLTAADTVIIVDPWWNPMGENQAIDRAHRIGQTKKVLIYKVITKNTIEEKILSLQESKKEMFEFIIDDGQNIIKNLNTEELRKLLEYQQEKNELL